MKQLEILFDDEELEVDENEEIYNTLIRLADKVRTDMNMEDWTFVIKYEPDEYDGNVAEVTGSIHKEGEITIYQYDPITAYRTMAHEMGHCLIGRVTETQKALIENYRNVQDSLVSRLEEETIDCLINILERPPKPYGE